MKKKIAIIIPHYNGLEILDECLSSLSNTANELFNVYIVDNGSTDNSIQHVEDNYSWVNIFKLNSNLGYSGGCNYGFNNTEEEYIIFLNNDTIHQKNWLSFLFEFMEANPHYAACQPKILSYYNRVMFDYSGACGGEIDKYAYPFTRGRVFDSIEEDTGQYDKLNKDIFWASGTALMARRKALIEVGVFDDDFFAHMEEIDLCWRLQSFNWKIAVIPSSIIYHHSGYTLGKMNKLKMFLNHRNNLFMLYKNVDENVFYSTFIKRILFELLTLIVSCLKFDFKRCHAVIHALYEFSTQKNKFKKKREFIQMNKNTEVSNYYNKSIVFQYFLKKKHKYSQL